MATDKQTDDATVEAWARELFRVGSDGYDDVYISAVSWMSAPRSTRERFTKMARRAREMAAKEYGPLVEAARALRYCQDYDKSAEIAAIGDALDALDALAGETGGQSDVSDNR